MSPCSSHLPCLAGCFILQVRSTGKEGGKGPERGQNVFASPWRMSSPDWSHFTLDHKGFPSLDEDFLTSATDMYVTLSLSLSLSVCLHPFFISPSFTLCSVVQRDLSLFLSSYPARVCGCVFSFLLPPLRVYPTCCFVT